MKTLVSLILMFMSVSATLAVKYDTIDEAIARGDLEDVQAQIAAFPERIQKGKHPTLTPLNQAILRKKEEIAVVLIDAGADVDTIDNDKSRRTPLHLCVDRDLPLVAKALLKKKAKPNEWDKAGWTPLHNAAAKNRFKITEVLLEGGANPKILSERKGTPLHEAAVSASPELVKLLLAAGVDKSHKAFDGGTAYDVAVRSENEAILELLKP